MSVPPASSVTWPQGNEHRSKVPGERTREVTLDPGDLRTLRSETRARRSLPGPDAGHPLHGAGGRAQIPAAAATSSNPANMKLGWPLNPRATHENTLVMRRSLGDDEDQGAEVSNAVRDHRRRARCVPDRSVNAGNLRSLAGTSACLTTCAHTGPSIAAYVLLSSRSRVRVAVGAHSLNRRSDTIWPIVPSAPMSLCACDVPLSGQMACFRVARLLKRRSPPTETAGE